MPRLETLIPLFSRSSPEDQLDLVQFIRRDRTVTKTIIKKKKKADAGEARAAPKRKNKVRSLIKNMSLAEKAALTAMLEEQL